VDKPAFFAASFKEEPEAAVTFLLFGNVISTSAIDKDVFDGDFTGKTLNPVAT
jgi:hypothetical protein